MLDSLSEGLFSFKNGLKDGVTIFALQKNWTDVIDFVVQKLFESSRSSPNVAVLALGGYGRREMSPYSDIDLLFLHDGATEGAKGAVDAVLYPLWDSKFEAGGATRTIKQCAGMFYGDIKAASAMCDARFVAGDDKLSDRLFDLLQRQLQKQAWRRKFARAKYLEQELRFKKFGGSIYMLEPHIKEGEGGLREYQTACLMGAKGEGNEFLFKIRAWLHFLSGQREDRLTFENQKLVAEELDLSPDELMEKYYRVTTSVHKESEKVMESAAPLFRRIYNKWRSERIRKITGFDPSWQRLVANSDMLYEALSFLHDKGDLKKLIPSFERLRFKAQYGAYHVYTVDVHSLLALKMVIELGRKKSPVAIRKAYKRIKKKDLLFLATLLHDIGKGRGENHTTEGAKIAREEALRLGYSAEDADDIAFLVSSHLIMPRLAFSRDLADPHLIENFAGSVGTMERLDMLLVLTYADIKAIGPDVWTAWKERLLNTFYVSVKGFLAGHKTGSERYLIAHSADEIKVHTEMYNAFMMAGEVGKSPHVMVKHLRHHSHSEFLIMANDAPGIFLKIVGVMTAHNVDILDAEINTGKNGIVLDILQAQNEIGGSLSDSLADRIIAELKEVFSGKDVDLLINKSERILKKRGGDIEPKVVIDNDVSAYYTVIDIFANDRIGLLYDLGAAFFKTGCSIDVAKILTKADTAVDSFYIRDFNGQKITDRKRLEEIKKALLAAT